MMRSRFIGAILALLLPLLVGCYDIPQAPADSSSAVALPPPAVVLPTVSASNPPVAQRKAMVAWSAEASAVAMPPAAPMVLPAGRDKFAEGEPNRWTSAAQQPVSTISLDVSKSSYAVVRRFLRSGEMPPVDAVRGDDMINYFPYAYPLPKDRGNPFKINATVVPSPWTKGAQLVHIGLKGWDVNQETRPRANLTLLLDVSGSMGSPDRLPLVQQALAQLVDGLRPDDSVSIVTYANGVQVVLEPTPGSERDKVKAAIAALRASGGTAGGAGLQTAYAQARKTFDPKAVNRIILATDGDFNLGEVNPKLLEDQVKARRSDGIYLTILGVGTDNLNDALMQRLAHAGNGQAAYLDSLLEARKVLVEELSSTMAPIADDAKMQIEFNPANVAEYRLIGYETRKLQQADFLDPEVAGGQIGAGHSVTAIYEILPVGAPVRNIEPLRYQKPAKADPSAELAFVRIRYTLPGTKDYKVIKQGILPKDAAADLKSASDDVRFSVAVAGFSKLLQSGHALPGWGFDQAAALADGARGADSYGWRAELVQLIRAAKGLSR